MLCDQNKTSLERIEEDLAQARAAIREAIQSRNYKSERTETFIPRGSIYKNPYAFHQLSIANSLLYIGKTNQHFHFMIKRFPYKGFVW